MKNFKVQNNIENRNVEVTLTVSLPYQGSRDSDVFRSSAHNRGMVFDVIGQFRDHLVDALNARMKACVSNLMAHQDDIILNDGVQIVYQRKDKTVHAFNIPSYNAMRDAIKALQNSAWEEFASNKQFIDQTIKALFWVPAPEDKSGALKYGDLISTLMEIHICGFDAQI